MGEWFLKLKKWFKKTFENVLKVLEVVKNKTFKMLKVSWLYFKKHYVKIGFYFLTFIFILNTIFMTVFLINRNYDYKILDKLYAEAILPDQNLDTTLATGIVKVEKIDYEEISLGDKVVFCCDMGVEENWIQEVVGINRGAKRLQTTYDGVTTTSVDEDEVKGVFVEEANFIGTLYYTAMFLRGYILLVLSEVLFIYIYHYLFIQKKLSEILSKPKITESDLDDENN
ncbi:MAG: hypothetical protein ACLFPM_02810 [Candidatus Izemoplasmatales bacterium]